MADPKYYGYDRSAAHGAAVRRLLAAVVTLAATSIVIFSIFVITFGSRLPVFIAEEALLSLFGVEVQVESVRPAGLFSFSIEDLSIKNEPFDLTARTAVLTLRPSLGGVRISRIALVDPVIVIRMKTRGTGRPKLQTLLDRLEHVSLSISNGRVILQGDDRSMTFFDLDAVHRRFFDVGFVTATGTVLNNGDGRGINLSGEVTATLWVRGPNGRRTLSGVVTGEGIGYGVGGYLFSGDAFSAPLTLDGDELSIDGFAIDGFGVRNDDHDMRFTGMTAGGDMRLFSLPDDQTKRGATFLDVFVVIPETGEVDLELLDIRAGEWEVIARTEDASVTPGLIRSLGSVLPGDTGTWEWGGRMAGEVIAGHDGSDGAKGRVDVTCSGLSFSSPEWTYVVDGINGDIEVTWRSPESGKVTSETTIEARGFQALVGDIFVDFTDRRLSTFWTGTLVVDSGIEDMEWTLTVPGVLRVRAAGDVIVEKHPAVGDLSLNLEVIDLGELYDLVIRDYVGGRIPKLADGSVAGSAGVRVDVSGNLTAPRLRGDVAVDVSEAVFGSGAVEVTVLNVVMPFRLDVSKDAPSIDSPDVSPGDRGTVSLSKGHMFGVEVGETALSVSLMDNVFLLHGPVTVPVSGGEVLVDGFTVRNPLSPDREAEADFAVADFDLAPLFASIWDVEMGGTLSGGYDSVEIREGKLSTTGGMTVDIADGEAVMTNLWGADVFSSRRRIGMDIAFEDISLEAITEPTDVGRVSGVVSGSLKDLIIAYGEPQRFVFDAYTVEKRGVPRRVSVDFVDNISILGSGTDIFTEALNKGVNRFVGEYRYSEMGIHLELAGAYFTVSGTVVDGGTEYFIKRSGPFGINVVNRNPNNSIRFHDMMSRLKRIQVESKEDIVIEK